MKEPVCVRPEEPVSGGAEETASTGPASSVTAPMTLLGYYKPLGNPYVGEALRLNRLAAVKSRSPG